MVLINNRSKKKQNEQLIWIDIAKDFYRHSEFSTFRDAKQCRSYWISHLNPQLNK